MDNYVDMLVEISKRINKGVNQADFCIKAEHGMGYDSTPLENEYEKTVSDITKLLKENCRFITNEILEKLNIVFNNVYKAYDSFRARTPACGGDYTDIDSIIKLQTSWLKSEFRSAQRKLKETDTPYFNQLKGDLLI